MKQIKITISGIVQGVGFRPFIYRLAKSLDIYGYVFNHSSGVEIVAQAQRPILDIFLKKISDEPPLHSKINSIHTETIHVPLFTSFVIKSNHQSIGEDHSSVLSIPPDLAICPACIQDLQDPNNRRYQYPFITCVQCGPRFSIVKKSPFDRENSSMSEFPMCDKCKKEYTNPNNRRFHAVTISCKECGPRLQLFDTFWQSNFDNSSSIEILTQAVQLLKQGYILAIQSIGGFHLACDATNEEAVNSLRIRKHRKYKPLAVMFPNHSVLSEFVYANEEELRWLSSEIAPIVLLKKKSKLLSQNITFNNPRIGAMLPFTPIHLLLCDLFQQPLVMTSGNISNDRMVHTIKDAKESLNTIADFFLVNNREIIHPIDDSVVKIINLDQSVIPLIYRRSRGYVPNSFHIHSTKTYLCVGGELKNTFSIVKDNKVIMSQYNGDLSSPSNYDFFKSSIGSYQDLYNTKFDFVISDMHPNYHSTLYAQKREFPVFKVQHHHAHLAACLADNQYEDKVIGIIMDGTGYGTDGKLWGSEFFIADKHSFERTFHFSDMALIGGEKPIREPWRIALSVLFDSEIPLQEIYRLPFVKNIPKDQLELFISVYKQKINTVYSSGCGRLFDAISALVNLCLYSDYEGMAAIELENILYKDDITINQKRDAYSWIINEAMQTLEWKTVIQEVVSDIQQDVPASTISYKFHNSILACIETVSVLLRKQYHINIVALSGGCFLNEYLLSGSILTLEKAGFTVLYHKDIPTDDSGLSFGQAAIVSRNA
jgi:hydrogenase maturation protein HypF